LEHAQIYAHIEDFVFLPTQIIGAPERLRQCMFGIVAARTVEQGAPTVIAGRQGSVVTVASLEFDVVEYGFDGLDPVPRFVCDTIGSGNGPKIACTVLWRETG